MEIRLPALSGGINLRDLKHKVQDNQSPNMMNMWYRDRTLGKRWGQELVATIGTVRGVSKEFEGYVGLAAGTTLYKWDTATNDLTSIGTIAGTEGVFCEFNGKLYYLDGTEIWEISASWVCTAVVPYKPVVYINCKPDFSDSTPNEAFNLIGAGFTVHYNGNGTSAVYTLPLQSLDATTVTVSVGGTALTEGTHFTVNRTAGTVNFAAGSSPHGAPATGTNNVYITAYKTVGGKSQITGCKVAIPFGGESGSVEGGSRLFVMKNSAHPRTYWYSDLGGGQSYGAAYWPDNQYEELNQNNDAITAAGKQSGTLIIFKENSLFSVGYQFDGQSVYFPVKEVNSTIGCDIPKSVQLIENYLTFANTKNGVYIIINLSGNTEETVRCISSNVNGTGINDGILSEQNLTAATSHDYDTKYWLAVNGRCYVLDYSIKTVVSKPENLSWFRFNNINASYWYENYTIHGTRIAKFITDFVDFGRPIEAWWESKSFDFDAPNYQKTINFVYPSVRSETNTDMVVTVSSEKTNIMSKRITLKSFSLATLDLSLFTLSVVRYARPHRLKPKLKKVVYCQIKVYSNTLNADANITDLVIDYTISRGVK